MLARSCSTAWHLSFGNTYILNLWTPLAKLARCPFGPLLPRGSGPTLPVLPRGPPYIYYVGDLNFLFFLFRLYIIIYPLKFKYRPLLLRFLLYLHNNKCPLSLSIYMLSIISRPFLHWVHPLKDLQNPRDSLAVAPIIFNAFDFSLLFFFLHFFFIISLSVMFLIWMN